MNLNLLHPLFVMVLLNLAVLIAMGHARFVAIKSGKIDMKYFKTLSLGEPTDYMLKTSRHFANLFEVPILFYVGCVAALALQRNDLWLHIWAWSFVTARILQAIIHIGPNKIRPRFILYCCGWVSLLAFWITLVF